MSVCDDVDQVDDDNDDVDEEEEDEEEWVTDIGLDAAAAELMTEDAGSPCSVQLLCVNDNRWVTAVSTADGAVTVSTSNTLLCVPRNSLSIASLRCHALE